MTAVTPGREELAIEVMNVRRRIHGLDDLDLATLRRIKRDAGINEAFAIADALLARLAANPPDPDAMNEKRALEDAQLASNVREATIEECAKIVDAECERILSKQTLTTAGDLVTQNAVNANLRMIACFLPELSASIRALSTTGQSKP